MIDKGVGNHVAKLIRTISTTNNSVSVLSMVVVGILIDRMRSKVEKMTKTMNVLVASRPGAGDGSQLPHFPTCLGLHPCTRVIDQEHVVLPPSYFN